MRAAVVASLPRYRPGSKRRRGHIPRTYEVQIRSRIVNKNTILAPADHLAARGEPTVADANLRAEGDNRRDEGGRTGGMRFTRNCRGSASAINFDALIKRSRFEPTRRGTKTQRQRASGYDTYVCT